MQTPLDAPFEQVQPDTTKIFAAPFLISDRVSKRALLFHRVFKRYRKGQTTIENIIMIEIL